MSGNPIARSLHSAEAYRKKALELCATANKTTDPFIRAELESLAFVYMRLAERSERLAAARPDQPDNDKSEDD